MLERLMARDKKVGTLQCVRKGTCPMHNDMDRGGCNFWWERTMDKLDEDKSVVVKNCIGAHLPFFFLSFLKSMDTNAAHTSAGKNEMEKLVSLATQARLERDR